MKASDSVENLIPDLSSSESICKDPSTTNAPLIEKRSKEVNQYSRVMQHQLKCQSH